MGVYNADIRGTIRFQSLGGDPAETLACILGGIEEDSETSFGVSLDLNLDGKPVPSTKRAATYYTACGRVVRVETIFPGKYVLLIVSDDFSDNREGHLSLSTDREALQMLLDKLAADNGWEMEKIL